MNPFHDTREPILTNPGIAAEEDGFRTVHCPDCGYQLTLREISKSMRDYGYQCLHCPKVYDEWVKKDVAPWNDVFDMKLKVLHAHRNLLNITPRYWWHVTSKLDWAPPNDAYVHVGMPETVRWLRANYQGRSKTPFPLYVYRVALKPSMDVEPWIEADFNRWPTYTTAERYVANKYVNAVEVAGSVSLLVPFGGLTEITRVSRIVNTKQNMTTDYRDEVYRK